MCGLTMAAVLVFLYVPLVKLPVIPFSFTEKHKKISNIKDVNAFRIIKTQPTYCN